MRIVQAAALAFWIGCVVFVLVPRTGSSSPRFHQPAAPLRQILRHEE
jgi:hypothetical protein